MATSRLRSVILVSALVLAALTIVFLVVSLTLVHAQQGCGDHLRNAVVDLVRDSKLTGRPLNEVRSELEGEFGGDVSCVSHVVGLFECQFAAICGPKMETIKFSVKVDDSMRMISLKTIEEGRSD